MSMRHLIPNFRIKGPDGAVDCWRIWRTESDTRHFSPAHFNMYKFCRTVSRPLMLVDSSFLTFLSYS